MRRHRFAYMCYENKRARILQSRRPLAIKYPDLDAGLSGPTVRQQIHYRFLSTAYLPKSAQPLGRSQKDVLVDFLAEVCLHNGRSEESHQWTAPAESKGNASDVHPSAEEFTKCVAVKVDPELCERAKGILQLELETKTDPERRQNIEACLEYVMQNGYPFIDEVFIALDGVVEHATEEDFFATGRDWLALTSSGRMRKGVAFVIVSR